MSRMIFVNLPVADLERSKSFFTTLGFTLNLQFTDEKAACILISETIGVMLLTHEFFMGFSKKPITDTAQSCEVLNCLTQESREAVDALVDKAVSIGGREAGDRMDYGFMYSRAFEDPDGHRWEILWMDQSRVQG